MEAFATLSCTTANPAADSGIIEHVATFPNVTVHVITWKTLFQALS